MQAFLLHMQNGAGPEGEQPQYSLAIGSRNAFMYRSFMELRVLFKSVNFLKREKVEKRTDRKYR